jgi:ABC-type cobalamin/Fe3+-siderophores transport system ATPase subunit
MITKITISKQLLSLIPQEWNNIPSLAVVAGLNGSGKSQLLNAISKWIEPTDNSVTYTHENNRGVLTTLSVPLFRSQYAGPEILGSQLSIELLFEDDLVEKHCDLVKVAGGAELLRFRQKDKARFAQQVSTFNAEKFVHFTALLNRLAAFAGSKA